MFNFILHRPKKINKQLYDMCLRATNGQNLHRPKINTQLYNNCSNASISQISEICEKDTNALSLLKFDECVRLSNRHPVPNNHIIWAICFLSISTLIYYKRDWSKEVFLRYIYR